MPLARYFLFVGGALMALLLVVNAYMPSPVVANAAVEETTRPVVRIHSTQKLPERIVYDTSIPTIVPPPVMVAQVSAPTPVRKPALEALAQATPTDLNKAELSKAEPKKPEPRHVQKRKIARHPARPPMIAYAQGPRFDFDLFSRN